MFLTLVTPPAVEPLTIAQAMTQLRLDEANQEPEPSVAPTIALAGLGAGNCANGAHRVACSFVTADGETTPGPLSTSLSVVDKTVNGQIAVSGIPVGSAAVTTVKLWMALVNTTSPLYYAGSVSNGTLTATINLADASLGVQAPSTNTTTDPEIAACITDARTRCEDVTGRQLIAATWNLSGPSFPRGLGRNFIELPRPNLLSVTSVQYRDINNVVQTWDPANYVVTTPAGPQAARGRITLAYRCIWPVTIAHPEAVSIRFTAGYGPTAASIPGSVVRGIRLALGTFYNQEKNDVTGMNVLATPMVSERLWKPYKSSPSVLEP